MPLVAAASPQAAAPSAVSLRAAPTSVGLSAYRAYASAQAGMLVRMSRMLAREIADGNVEAAQNDYAMTHRYLERISAAASALDRDLDARLEGRLADGRGGEPAPGLSGFRRLEFGLFAARSTKGLASDADRLVEDARRLQAEVSTRPLPADVLVDRAAATMAAVSAQTLAEGGEPYSKSDLWDIEANLDGVQEIVAAVGPRRQAQDPLAIARIGGALAEARQRLARFEEGCGYKSFDELSSADKAGLGTATAALARELSRLRAVSAID